MPGKLEVGDTLGEAFAIYRDQAGVLLPVAFWLFLAVAIVNGLAGDDLALFPLVVVVSTVAATLYTGMVVNLVGDLHDGRRDSSVGDLFRSVLPVLLPLIGAGILFGLGIGIGFALLIAPGLYLLTIWALIAPAIVVERRDILDAFRRSRQLVKGHGWYVLGVVVVAFLLAIVVSLILNSIAVDIADGPLLRIVFSALASTFTAPVEGLVAAVLYFRLRPLDAPAPPEPLAPPGPAAP
jgi:hypothetical protein